MDYQVIFIMRIEELSFHRNALWATLPSDFYSGPCRAVQNSGSPHMADWNRPKLVGSIHVGVGGRKKISLPKGYRFGGRFYWVNWSISNDPYWIDRPKLRPLCVLFLVYYCIELWIHVPRGGVVLLVNISRINLPRIFCRCHILRQPSPPAPAFARHGETLTLFHHNISWYVPFAQTASQAF